MMLPKGIHIFISAERGVSPLLVSDGNKHYSSTRPNYCSPLVLVGPATAHSINHSRTLLDHSLTQSLRSSIHNFQYSSLQQAPNLTFWYTTKPPTRLLNLSQNSVTTIDVLKTGGRPEEQRRRRATVEYWMDVSIHWTVLDDRASSPSLDTGDKNCRATSIFNNSLTNQRHNSRLRH